MNETSAASAGKKILIYAEGCSWGMGPALRDSFTDLGHQAEVFDWTQFLFAARANTLANRLLDRLLFKLVARRINAAFLGFLVGKKYDLILVTKGLHLYPETVRSLKAVAKRTANWNPDDFFNPVNSNQFLRASFPEYDLIYTPRRHLIDEYLSRGAKKCEFIDWYYVPQYFRTPPSQTGERIFDSDITFIGSWSRRREALIGALKGFNVRVYGGSWKWASKEFRGRVACLPPVYNEEMCSIIVNSRINLNILTRENRDTSNLRNFEIPACGGFQLSERSDEILRLFREGEDLACFDGGEELAAKCAHYLSDEADRARIAANGCARVTSGGHTPSDRARQILNTVFL